MSAPSSVPRTPQMGASHQPGAVPPPTPPDTDRRAQSVVDTTSSTNAYQVKADVGHALDDICREIRGKEDLVADLQARLEEQGPAMRRLENCNVELKKKNKTLVKQEKEASAKARGNEAAHNEAARQCRELTQDLADEKHKLSAAESSLSRLQKENDDLEANISSIREEAAQEAEAAHKEKASLAAELDEVRTSLTGARQEAQEIKDRADFLSNGISNAEGSLKETEEKLDAAEKKAASEKERAEKAESELEGIRRILGMGTGKRSLTPPPDDEESSEGKRQRMSGPDTQGRG